MGPLLLSVVKLDVLSDLAYHGKVSRNGVAFRHEVVLDSEILTLVVALRLQILPQGDPGIDTIDLRATSLYLADVTVVSFTNLTRSVLLELMDVDVFSSRAKERVAVLSSGSFLLPLIVLLIGKVFEQELVDIVALVCLHVERSFLEATVLLVESGDVRSLRPQVL